MIIIMAIVSDAEMKTAGFHWDPTRGYPRWTHSKTGVTCLRQSYMNNDQWNHAKREALLKVPLLELVDKPGLAKAMRNAIESNQSDCQKETKDG